MGNGGASLCPDTSICVGICVGIGVGMCVGKRQVARVPKLKHAVSGGFLEGFWDASVKFLGGRRRLEGFKAVSGEVSGRRNFV